MSDNDSMTELANKGEQHIGAEMGIGYCGRLPLMSRPNYPEQQVGYKRALREVLEDIEEENYRIWGYKRTDWDYVCGTNPLKAKIKARMEKA